jgi:class 3 adenylate cyclase/tetratricopeptide (TPR) repeat protein
VALQDASVPSVRKTVTLVFADASGWTSLGDQVDAEEFQAVQARYFAAMRAAVERHGGTVEKFVGDAVMAVFGIPYVHEDDCLRAVRAAADMRAALERLSSELEAEQRAPLGVRIGVNTGEVIAGDPGTGGSFATGDAVNVAARLEQTAEPGQILIGESTYRLVCDAVRVEAVELAVKGKPARLRAWRLLELVADGAPIAPRPGSPFVGRAAELERLSEALELARTTSGCMLVTVVGEPGVGKSRLVHEFRSSLDGEARLVVGRCPPYGEAVTYHPLAEVVAEVAGADVDALRELVGGDLPADLLAGAVGIGGTEGSSEETQWAARRLFEALAAERPLVLALDDVHWAEPTFLDLVEYVAGFSRIAPILIVCLTRPDLLSSRPSWTAPRGNASVLALERLPDHQAGALVDRLAPDLPADVRRQVLEAAEGNPLFVEHMLAFGAERGWHARGIPPSLNALLAARIDALDSDERAVIECASVEGRSFHRSTVAALLPPESRGQSGGTLLALVRRGLVRPWRSSFPGDDGFRFAHVLIRDVAYEGMLKRRRADLHERAADWLERQASGPGPDLDEVLGHHLERAYLYRSELGPHDDGLVELGARAARYLGRAGERALTRGDVAAAAALLERGAALLDDRDPALAEVLASLAMARTAGGELESAEQALARAVDLGEAHGTGSIRARASVERARIGLLTGSIPPDAARAEAEQAIAVLEPLGDDLGLAKAWLVLVLVHNWHLEYSALERAAERARFHARRAHAARDAADALVWTCPATVLGGRPVPEAIEAFERIASDAPGPLTEAATLLTLGCLRLMHGEPDAGRDLYGRSEAIYRELGIRLFAAAQSTMTGWSELVAGDADVAESLLRRGVAELEEMGERNLVSTAAAQLSRVLCTRGEHEEADRFAVAASEVSGEDPFNTVLIAGVRARIAAAQGDSEAAVLSAERAAARVRTADCLELAADTYRAQAEAMMSAGRYGDAAEALRSALRLYERRQNAVAAGRTRRALEALLRA